jgi:cytochrome c553
MGTFPGKSRDRRRAAGLLGLAFGLLVAVAAVAADGAAPDGAAIIAHGIGTVPACATCHGATGQGNATIGAPALAGDGVAYLREQLRHFAAGTRINPIMQPIAHALTPAERDAVAAAFAAMPAPVPHPVAAAADPLGARLARRGRWSIGLPGCEQCHGPEGIGVGPHFPHLAGLTASYIAAQLNAFRAGTRPGGPQGLMARVASKLTKPERAAVAAYFGAESGPVEKHP